MPGADVAVVKKKTKFPEPLVLHVAVGECVNIQLTDRREGPRASLHIGGLLRAINSSGINIGFNPEQTITPGQARTYRFYVDTQKIESTVISDFGGNDSGWDDLYGGLVVARAAEHLRNGREPRPEVPRDDGAVTHTLLERGAHPNIPSALPDG